MCFCLVSAVACRVYLLHCLLSWKVPFATNSVYVKLKYKYLFYKYPLATVTVSVVQIVRSADVQHLYAMPLHYHLL